MLRRDSGANGRLPGLIVAILLWLSGVAGAQAQEPIELAKSETQAVAKEKKAKAKTNELEVQASLHSRFTAQEEDGTPQNEFSLSRARIEVTWKPKKWIAGVMEAALDQVIEGSNAQGLVKDAYLELDFRKWMRVKFGQFKKPVSAMELTGKGKLPLVERGEGNRYLVRELEYGSRDLGFEVFGRLWKEAKLDYYLGVFNGAKLPSEEKDPNGAKDVVARVEAEVADGFKIGASGVWKGFDRGGVDSEEKPAFGDLGTLNLAYKKDGLWILAEGMWGKNHQIQSAPSAASAVLAGAYRIPTAWLGKEGALEPAVRLEWLKPDMDSDGQLLVASGGVNVWLAPCVRIMVQGEWTRPDETLAELFPDALRGWVQVAFDY